MLGAWSVRFVGWADWVDCRCFLSFVFLGVARRLEIPPCNTRSTLTRPSTVMEGRHTRKQRTTIDRYTDLRYDAGFAVPVLMS